MANNKKNFLFLMMIIVALINQVSAEFITIATVTTVVRSIVASVTAYFGKKLLFAIINDGNKDKTEGIASLADRMDEFTFSLIGEKILITNSRDYIIDSIVDKITKTNHLNDRMIEMQGIMQTVHAQYELLKEYATNDNRINKYSDGVIIIWCSDNLRKSVGRNLYSEISKLQKNYKVDLELLADSLKVSTHF